MIQVSALSFSYQGQSLFKNGSFSLGKGEKLGLVGKNGSGKSTLFGLLLGRLQPDAGTIQIARGYKIVTLQQHIQFQKPTVLQEAVLALPKEKQDLVYLAEKILFGLGFSTDDLEKSPLVLSGGYQLRLQLAKTLISEPDCLLLDEPTNYLDIVSIRWFIGFLKQWNGEFILITHDRQFMDQVTCTTLGIHREALRKVQGGTKNYFDQLLQEEQVHEKTVENVEKKRKKAEAWITRFGAKATKAAQAKSMEKALLKLPALERLNQIQALDFAFKEAPLPSKKALECHNLCFSYTDHPLIEKFSLTVEKGERIAIIGKNGRGKSTALSLLSGDLVPASGVIKFAQNCVMGKFLQTHIDRLQPDRSVQEEIASANPELKFSEVKQIAGLMLFSGTLAEKKCAILSGGERARVLLGKIIATPSNLLLLDEPTHHLDMESIEALIDALEAFSGSLVIVTHSELLLERLMFDKIVLMHSSGHETFLGDYFSFLEKKGWDEGGQETPAPTNVKNERQIRAEKVQERSRLLRPIKEKIARLEKEISAFEKKFAEQTENMQQASYAQEGELIKNISKEILYCEKELNRLYSELEKALDEETKLNY
jgi:ATP-binding cassette subfamily F protein 3